MWAEDDDGGATLHLSGELDMATAPALANALEATERDRPLALVLDLADLTFMDVSGLHVVAETAERVRARGGSIALVAAQPQVRRLFELTRREDLLETPSPAT